MPDNKISKREFIKYCLYGSCGLIAGFGQLENYGKELVKNLVSKTPDPNLWKWSKEAYYYAKTPRGVKCQICPNVCEPKPNELSTCKNRINIDGKLYTIAYGNPCAVHIDPIEKKPLLHFLPMTKTFSVATAGCNLACLNCQNWTISQFSPRETKNYDLMPDKLVEQALASGCRSIAYTYAEPITFYEYTFDSAKLARESGLKNVLKSAGFINEEPLRNFCKYIDAANIDLKSFSDEIYLNLNGGNLEPVLRTLKILKEEGVWLEITNLIVPSWTDDLDMIKRMCDWLFENGLGDSPLHFSRFHPMHKLTQLPSTPISTLNKAHKIAIDAGIKYVYVGNVPAHSAENTYCHSCGNKIIERRGYYILNNYIEDGKCKYCGTIIPGVWNNN